MMRHKRRQIDATMLDHRHQPPHPLLPARAERRHDLLIAEARIERLVGRDELARVDAEARQRAAGPDGAQRVLERLLPAERLDRDVDAAAAGQPLDLRDGIAVLDVQRDVRAEPSRDLEPLGDGIDADDERRALQLRAQRRAQADRPLREDRDRSRRP